MRTTKSEWMHEDEFLSEWALLTDVTEEVAVRKKVIGGWLIYRDLIDRETEKALTSTVIFIEDVNHSWIIE